MLIDRKNTGWAVVTALLGGAAVGVYLWDAPRHLNGPRGSTAVGLTLGGAALLIMLFCAGLGLKRRVPHWRLGRAQSWMRGHVWLGLLLCLLVALHGAFRLGGAMTLWLWGLLGVVTLSGIVGLVIQQLVPTLLWHSVPGETLAQQVDRQIAALVGLAEALVRKYVGDINQNAPPWPPASGEAEAKPPAGGEPLRLFFIEHVRPFLGGQPDASLASPTRSESLFTSLRTSTPPHIHPGVDALEELCDRRRQLFHQRRLMRALQGWLIIHVPLSWMLLVLTLAHAVIALRY